MSLKILRCSLVFLTFLLPSGSHAEEEQFYPNPGIVALKGDGVIGSDHLYNIPDHIGVEVEIFKPPGVEIPFDEAMIKGRIENIFRNAGLEPQAVLTAGEPKLPFFHLLIMLNPIDEGYVAYCQGRLFEKIEIKRVKLAEETIFQGITWETSNLIITPTSKLTREVADTADDIAKTFVERYKFFETIRTQVE